jgi:hypothetical protein
VRVTLVVVVNCSPCQTIACAVRCLVAAEMRSVHHVGCGLTMWCEHYSCTHCAEGSHRAREAAATRRLTSLAG